MSIFTYYLVTCKILPIALSITLGYDKAMRLRPTSIPKGWFDLVLLTLVIVVLIYLFT